jgi:hypothetical protein
METLKVEIKRLSNDNENLKKKFSSEIKLYKPSEIKNTIFEERKITLWERIKKTLGMI